MSPKKLNNEYTSYSTMIISQIVALSDDISRVVKSINNNDSKLTEYDSKCLLRDLYYYRTPRDMELVLKNISSLSESVLPFVKLFIALREKNIKKANNQINLILKKDATTVGIAIAQEINKNPDVYPIWKKWYTVKTNHYHHRQPKSLEVIHGKCFGYSHVYDCDYKSAGANTYSIIVVANETPPIYVFNKKANKCLRDIFHIEEKLQSSDIIPTYDDDLYEFYKSGIVSVFDVRRLASGDWLNLLKTGDYNTYVIFMYMLDENNYTSLPSYWSDSTNRISALFDVFNTNTFSREFLHDDSKIDAREYVAKTMSNWINIDNYFQELSILEDEVIHQLLICRFRQQQSLRNCYLTFMILFYLHIDEPDESKNEEQKITDEKRMIMDRTFKYLDSAEYLEDFGDLGFCYNQGCMYQIQPRIHKHCPETAPIFLPTMYEFMLHDSESRFGRYNVDKQILSEIVNYKIKDDLNLGKKLRPISFPNDMLDIESSDDELLNISLEHVVHEKIVKRDSLQYQIFPRSIMEIKFHDYLTEVVDISCKASNFLYKHHLHSIPSEHDTKHIEHDIKHNCYVSKHFNEDRALSVIKKEPILYAYEGSSIPMEIQKWATDTNVIAPHIWDGNEFHYYDGIVYRQVTDYFADSAISRLDIFPKYIQRHLVRRSRTEFTHMWTELERIDNDELHVYDSHVLESAHIIGTHIRRHISPNFEKKLKDWFILHNAIFTSPQDFTEICCYYYGTMKEIGLLEFRKPYRQFLAVDFREKIYASYASRNEDILLFDINHNEKKQFYAKIVTNVSDCMIVRHMNKDSIFTQKYSIQCIMLKEKEICNAQQGIKDILQYKGKDKISKLLSHACLIEPNFMSTIMLLWKIDDIKLPDKIQHNKHTLLAYNMSKKTTEHIFSSVVPKKLHVPVFIQNLVKRIKEELTEEFEWSIWFNLFKDYISSQYLQIYPATLLFLIYELASDFYKSDIIRCIYKEYRSKFYTSISLLNEYLELKFFECHNIDTSFEYQCSYISHNVLILNFLENLELLNKYNRVCSMIFDQFAITKKSFSLFELRYKPANQVMYRLAYMKYDVKYQRIKYTPGLQIVSPYRNSGSITYDYYQFSEFSELKAFIETSETESKLYFISLLTEQDICKVLKRFFINESDAKGFNLVKCFVPAGYSMHPNNTGNMKAIIPPYFKVLDIIDL